MSERAKIGDPFYRYVDPYDTDSIHLCTEEWRVDKITPAGYWIESYGERKFVLAGGGKRYAYPSKEEALDSYIIRKNRQLQHLASTKHKAEHGLFLAKELKEGRVPRPKPGTFIDFGDEFGTGDTLE